MICSSLNRLRFIVRLLWSDGLYPILEEFSGLRSGPIGRLSRCRDVMMRSSLYEGRLSC